MGKELDVKEKGIKKYGTYTVTLILSLVLYFILTIMYAGYMTFGTIFMIVIQPIIVFMLFLYLEELAGKKKLGKYITLKAFYIFTIIIPIVIAIIFFTTSKILIKNELISSFALLFFVNCGTLGIFTGIKSLIRFILKKAKKIE